MTRKLTCTLFTSASLVLALSACSTDDKPLPAVKSLSACDAHQMATGGYMWTFTDAGRNTYGTVEPFSTWDEATQSGDNFTVTAMADQGDPTNNVCMITGTKPAGERADELDSCGDKPLYPVAGIGFSFLDKNVRFNICDKIGVRFRAKGTLVGTDGTAAAALRVRVAFPTTANDLWQLGDKWASGPEEQRCKCQHELEEGTKTCFGFYGKDIDVTGDWEWFTVLWGELSTPSWAGATPFEVDQVLKMQLSVEGTGDYTLAIDDIQFVLTADDGHLNWCATHTWDLITPNTPDFCNLVEAGDPLCTPGADPDQGIHF